MMKSAKRQTALLLLLPFVLAVSGCGGQEKIRVALPPAQDLKVQPKPQPTADIVLSETAAELYNSAIEAWGELGWLQVARICRWAKEHGSKEPCPPVN